jgi:hypothetical protein
MQCRRPERRSSAPAMLTSSLGRIRVSARSRTITASRREIAAHLRPRIWSYPTTRMRSSSPRGPPDQPTHSYSPVGRRDRLDLRPRGYCLGQGPVQHGDACQGLDHGVCRGGGTMGVNRPGSARTRLSHFNLHLQIDGTTSSTGRTAVTPSSTISSRCAGRTTAACTRRGGAFTLRTALPWWNRRPADSAAQSAQQQFGTHSQWDRSRLGRCARVRHDGSAGAI